MNRALTQAALREIGNSLGRFLTIISIVFLGTAFLSGLLITAPDMRATAEAEQRALNLHDIHIVSALGFDEEDPARVAAAPGVRAVMPAYSVSAYMSLGDQSSIAIVHALPPESGPELDALRLKEGRMPQSDEECLLLDADVDMLSRTGGMIGRKLRLALDEDQSLEDWLSRDEFTVVGVAVSPMYISGIDFGRTTLGNGTINAGIVVRPSVFTIDTHTDLYIKADVDDSAYSPAYTQAIDALKERLESDGETWSVQRRDRIVSEANEELADARQELARAEAERDTRLSEAEAELAAARQELSDGEKKLAEETENYDREIADAQKEIDDAQARLNREKKRLDDGKKEIADGEKEIESNRKKLDDQLAELEKGRDSLAELQKNMNALSEQLAALPSGTAQRSALQAQLTQLQTSYTEGSRELQQAQASFDEASAKLRNATRDLDSAKRKLETAESDYADAEKKLAQAKRDLDTGSADGKAQIEDAQAQIDDARGRIEASQAELETARTETQAQIEDAQAQIDDAQRQVDEIEEARWNVYTREDLPHFSEYGNAADRIESAALVFPVIFFFTAAMVALTSVTRMVEEQRAEIGAFKVLGYTSLQIARKYILFGFFSSLIGSILGVVVGMSTVPFIIVRAYSIQYHYKNVVLTYTPQIMVVTAVIAIVLVVVSALIACVRTVGAEPAALMRPKPPASGKRVLLERISGVWNAMGFPQRATFRHIARSRVRALMTVLGVAGCTSLLLTGFGIRDSVTSLIALQFPGIDKSGAALSVKSNLGEGEREAVRALARENGSMDTLYVASNPFTLSFQGKSDGVTLVIPEDPQRLPTFYDYRTRVGKKPIPLTDEGVVIVEKLANLMGVRVGDTVRLENEDGVTFDAAVTGIRENYMAFPVTVTPALYREKTGLEPEYSQLYMLLPGMNGAEEDAYAEAMLKDDRVVGILFTSYVQSRAAEMVETLSIVVMLILISAAILAFVVLFNLTSINITERRRELATLKVLGFLDGETAQYIIFENALLTLAGIMLGVIAGVFMHRAIIPTFETDKLMFGQDMHVVSVVLGVLLSALFMVAVNLVVFPRIKAIDMASSLKATE